MSWHPPSYGECYGVTLCSTGGDLSSHIAHYVVGYLGALLPRLCTMVSGLLRAGYVLVTNLMSVAKFLCNGLLDMELRLDWGVGYICTV